MALSNARLVRCPPRHVGCQPSATPCPPSQTTTITSHVTDHQSYTPLATYPGGAPQSFSPPLPHTDPPAQDVAPPLLRPTPFHPRVTPVSVGSRSGRTMCVRRRSAPPMRQPGAAVPWLLEQSGGLGRGRGKFRFSCVTLVWVYWAAFARGWLLMGCDWYLWEG